MVEEYPASARTYRNVFQCGIVGHASEASKTKKISLNLASPQCQIPQSATSQVEAHASSPPAPSNAVLKHLLNVKNLK